MSGTGPTLTSADFAALTFGDKLSLALALCRSYGLAVWGLLMAGILVLSFLFLNGLSWLGFTPAIWIGLADGSIAAESMSSLMMGLFCLRIIAALMMQFMLIGANTLVLLYLNNQAPLSVVQAFCLPWTRFGPVFLCVLLWLALVLLAQKFIATFGGNTDLAHLLEMGLALAFSIINNCALLYIADKIVRRHEHLSPIEAVLRPLAIVANKPLAWLGVFVFIMAIYMPLVRISLMSLERGLLVVALGAALGLSLASVYAIFLLGITYRQTLAQYEQGGIQLH